MIAAIAPDSVVVTQLAVPKVEKAAAQPASPDEISDEDLGRHLMESVPKVRAFLRSRGCPSSCIEDVMQETFREVVRTRKHLDLKKANGGHGYVLRNCAQKLIQSLRTPDRREDRFPHAIRERERYERREPDPLEHLEEQEDRQLLRRFIAELPESQQKVLGFALADFSISEIAQRLKICRSTANRRLHDAIAGLRRRFARRSA